jgi:ribosomal-protein-alanine N-acetyltransferase
MASTLDLVIESERLRLEAVSEAHAETIFREFTAEITEFMGPKPPGVMDETLAFVHRSRERMLRGEDFVAAVLVKETGEYLGGAGLNRIDSDTPELGIWIKKGAHGHAYAGRRWPRWRAGPLRASMFVT